MIVGGGSGAYRTVHVRFIVDPRFINRSEPPEISVTGSVELNHEKLEMSLNSGQLRFKVKKSREKWKCKFYSTLFSYIQFSNLFEAQSCRKYCENYLNGISNGKM